MIARLQYFLWREVPRLWRLKCFHEIHNRVSVTSPARTLILQWRIVVRLYVSCTHL